MKNEIPNKKAKLVYKEPEKLSREHLESYLASNDIEKINSALLSMALYEKDFAFASNIIFKFAKMPNDKVRGVAILCIGYLARNFGILPSHPTLELIQAGIDDVNPDVKDKAYTAGDELDLFIPQLGKQLIRDIDAYYGVTPDENVED